LILLKILLSSERIFSETKFQYHPEKLPAKAWIEYINANGIGKMFANQVFYSYLEKRKNVK
jgi:hypothetical protein